MFPLALVTSITLTGILIYLGVFTFGLLYILRYKEHYSLQNSKEFWQSCSAFLIYIFAFTVSKLINSGFSEGLNTFFSLCQDFFIFLWILFYVNKTSKNQEYIKSSILFASIISIVYGLMQFFNLDIFHRQVVAERLSGFHKNPYSYGGQLIVIFFFLLGMYKNVINRIFPLVGLAGCLLCILNTSERAVIFGVFVGLVFYLLYSGMTKKNLLPLAALIISPVIVTCFINRKLLTRIRKVVLPLKGAPSNIRFKLWQVAVAVWKRNIFFGVGKFPAVYHETTSGVPLQVLTHAHNVYLQILVSSGLIGLLAFLNLFFTISVILFQNLYNNQYALCLISIIISFSVEGLFEYFWGDSEVRCLLIYFIGYVLGNIIVSKNNKKAESNV